MAISRVDAQDQNQTGIASQDPLYSSRIRPSTAPMTVHQASATALLPEMPSLSPLAISTRWDSPLNSPRFINHSPTSPKLPRWDAWPDRQPPLQPAFGSAQTTDTDFQYKSPSRPATAKSHVGPEGVAVENFSRPRKLSIRQPNVTDRTTHVSNAANLTPADLLSVSSSRSAGAFSPPRGPRLADSRLPRPRNVPGVAVRLPFSSSATRIDTYWPGPPGSGAVLPWMTGEEPRSSFRSQLSSSTAFGTAATERSSSVLTKDTSITSLYMYSHPDEPSLEDVMGMYEKGFVDDEDDHGAAATHAADAPGRRVRLDFHRPIPTAPEKFQFESNPSSDSDVAQMPSSRSALDAEIRKSKLLFASPAFTSSVPALSGDDDDFATEKRDSGKSLDSDPSIVSASHEMKKSTAIVTIPASATLDTSAREPEPTSPRPVPDSAILEAEDPGSRDRYGFKKKNQYINREQYDAWNNGYSQYLSRRRKKWVTYLKDCSLMTDHPIRFPPANAKTKRFVRKGIPPDWRGAAWFYYAGGPAILAKHSGLYEKLLRSEAKEVDVEAIERDLHRTFPDNIQFQPTSYHCSTSSSDASSPPVRTPSTSSNGSRPGPAGLEGEPPIISSLRRVLHAFAIYNPRIGYCQSLNFLAGLLLLFVETEEQCFWLLNVITIIYLPGTHDMSLEGSKVDLGVLMTELRDTMPDVWDKIGGELEGGPAQRPSTSKSLRTPKAMRRRRNQPGLSTERLPPITLCMTAWFMSCFIGTLPIETTLRVWDVFFYEGSKTLFRIALSIFKTGESEIKAVSDPMEMFSVVQSLPRRMLDANALIETCFKRRNGFGHLSQAAIDDRRQERRERTIQELRNKLATSGNVAELEVEHAPRMGAFFSMRRRDLSRPRAAEA
ncbi:hypothetical protein CDD81_2393 [Ophiocordyceps australis]|uniref:Rab-GAP TBC domain-containing protein n=1 Tax=Ophiocordyceps australis TaxID=1399860 RepID=A0A2C5XRK8_9HYPO|nr:hypothetical protein CDD81_2393 [Ophiocordyceps australis]